MTMNITWEEQIINTQNQVSGLLAEAAEISGHLEALIRQAEVTKMSMIQVASENRVRWLERNRGLTAIAANEQYQRIGWGLGLASAIIGGIVSKDPILALKTGMSGFDGLVREMGHRRLYVDLSGRSMKIEQEDSPTKRYRVSLERFLTFIEMMRNRALSGTRLGNFQNILVEMRKIAGVK